MPYPAQFARTDCSDGFAQAPISNDLTLFGCTTQDRGMFFAKHLTVMHRRAAKSSPLSPGNIHCNGHCYSAQKSFWQKGHVGKDRGSFPPET
jgi:hypothetical protein